jgi:hypothetical protein
MYKFLVPFSEKEQSVSIAKTHPLLMGQEVLALYVEANTKLIKNSVWQNAEFLNVNARGVFIHYFSLTLKRRKTCKDVAQWAL